MSDFALPRAWRGASPRLPPALFLAGIAALAAADPYPLAAPLRFGSLCGKAVQRLADRVRSPAESGQ